MAQKLIPSITSASSSALGAQMFAAYLTCTARVTPVVAQQPLVLPPPQNSSACFTLPSALVLWSPVGSRARGLGTPQAPAALIHTLSSAAPQVTLRGRSGPA